MVLRLVTSWLVPAGAGVIAVDDTMFRRAGRKVHAAYWGYDGSLKVPEGGTKVSRGPAPARPATTGRAVERAVPSRHTPRAL